MWKKALLVLFIAVAIFFCVTPPFSDTLSFHVSEVYPPARANKFIATAQGLVNSMAILAALKLGIIDLLHSTPSTYQQIASKLKLDERATHILLNSLVSYDILTYSASSGLYGLTTGAATHLISSSPDYLGHFFLLLSGQVERFQKLDEVVKAGGASIFKDSADTPNHPFWELFANVTIAGSRRAAEAMAKTISGWAEDRKELRILDVAAGSGTYGYTFAQTYPNAHVTLFDWPAIIPITEHNLAEFPTVKRTQVSFLGGDAFTSDLQGPYDVILVSHFYHHFSLERNIELSKRFLQNLKPDGKVIVNEFFASDPPVRSSMGNTFALMMLSWSNAGEAFRATEYDHILNAAGFGKIEHIGNFPFPNAYIVASRT